MSYFSASQEAAINSGILQMHNFFAAKNVFHAIKKGTITSISESNNHNAFYKNSIQNSTVVETETSGLFLARAYYLDKGTEFKAIESDQGAVSSNPKIKIITDITGNGFLKDAKDVYWDEKYYDVISAPRKHGLLENNFYNYYLEEVK